MKQPKRYHILVPAVLAAAVVLSVCGVSRAAETRFGAALRQNVIVMRWPKVMQTVTGDHGLGISETRMRLTASLTTADATVNAGVDSRAGFMSASSTGFGFGGSEGSLLGSGSPLRKWDWSADHLSDTNTSISSSIERLDAVFRAGPVDIDAGRQPISLGTSHFVGVLDVIAPFAPGDLDATYKPGVDALRIRTGVGMTGEAELIAVAASDIDEGALLGRFRHSVGSVDIEAVGGRFRRRGFGGIGWEGGVNPFGFWGEAALFGYRRGHETVRGWSKAAFSGVAGVDYYIEADFTVGGAFFYQDFGVRDADDLIGVYDESPFKEGWVFLSSASYGVVTLSKKLHPLVTADAAGLVNLVDSSTLWQPRLTVSTGDNTDLSVYGWIGTGDKPETVGGISVLQSEFGSMPSGGGFYARWFF